MKIRSNYVSNSSSSSFVIYNWFDLPEEKRNYIKNYNENALKVWSDNNIKFNKSSFSSLEYVFDDEKVYDMAYRNNLSEEEQDEIYNKYIKFAFGFVNNECVYYFQEHKNRNTCDVFTSMDNFKMGRWLKYNNIEYDETERQEF